MATSIDDNAADENSGELLCFSGFEGRLYMPVNAMNCTTESTIYVMELTVMRWMPMREWQKL